MKAEFAEAIERLARENERLKYLYRKFAECQTVEDIERVREEAAAMLKTQ